jgi:hypothetical protein
MGPLSMLFPNPAVKILEARLWEGARKRYLGEHPADQKSDDRTVMRKVRTVYRDTVAATVKEADHKVRAKWGQFKHGMTEELRTELATVLRMSEVDWYAVEVGPPEAPDVIAAPYQLLKRMTAALLFHFLRQEIRFENLDDETLEALATYAADEKFREILEDARGDYEVFQVGQSDHFAVMDIIEGDAYFLGDEKHHSLIDMVILCRIGANASDGDKRVKAAVKKWLQKDRKNRNNDRRFSGDGWEIEIEQIKRWASRG